MLAKLLKRLDKSDEERIAEATARLLEKYPVSRDSIWRIAGARGNELATFGGCYGDALQWAFAAPGFFENGMSGDLTQLLPSFKVNHSGSDADRPFTQLAMRTPRFG